MNFVSLFAGVGGFDLAFERAGMDCQAQVEIDAKCREVLANHWPEVPRWEDVHDVTAGRLCMASNTGTGGARNGNVPDPDRRGNSSNFLHGGNFERGTGTVDVLCGGFPCQDYSVAGLRGGLVGDRGALWWQFHRLVAECRPRWVVGENVPGLLSSNDGRDFGAIVGSLVELGYGVVWRVLDAQYFGVAQRRRRVFIVGHFGGIPRPEILAFAEGCTGDTPPRRQAGAIAAGELARSLGGVGGGQDYGANKGTLIPQVGPIATGFDWTRYGDSVEEQSPTIRVGSGLDIASPPAVAFHKMNAEAGWGEGLSTLRARDNKGDANLIAFVPDVASTLQSAIRGVPSTEQADGQLIVERPRNLGIQGGEVGVAGVVLNGGAEHPTDEGEFGGGEGHGGSFRLTDDDPTKPAFNVKAFAQNTRDEVRDLGNLAGALAAQPGMKQTTYLASPQVRRLTPLECERLQGFPDNWTAGQSDTQRYRQMGNAVAVPVVEWIGRNLAKAT